MSSTDIPKIKNSEFSFYRSNNDLRKTNALNNLLLKNEVSERKFGIEIEAFGLTRKQVRKILIEECDIDCRVEEYNHETKGHWKIVMDGSINFVRKLIDENTYTQSFEIVSPPLLLNKENLKLVAKVLDSLRRKGAKVNGSCGVHIHMDMSGILTPVGLYFLLLRYNIFEEYLDSFFIQSRRENKNRFCRSGKAANDCWDGRYPFYETPTGRIDEVAWISRLGHKFKSSSILNPPNAYSFYKRVNSEGNDDFLGYLIESSVDDRYRKLNFASYNKYKTIEFRQHEGSLRSDKIINWIRFCNDFINESIALASSYINFCDGLRLDTPTRITSFLAGMSDHIFSGVSQEVAEFMIKNIKTKNERSYNLLNSFIAGKNKQDLSIENRIKFYTNFNKAYPNIEKILSLREEPVSQYTQNLVGVTPPIVNLQTGSVSLKDVVYSFCFDVVGFSPRNIIKTLMNESPVLFNEKKENLKEDVSPDYIRQYTLGSISNNNNIDRTQWWSW